MSYSIATAPYCHRVGEKQYQIRRPRTKRRPFVAMSSVYSSRDAAWKEVLDRNYRLLKNKGAEQHASL